MLSVSQLIGFAAGATGVLLSYVATPATITVNGTSFSFTGASIGVAAANRLVIVTCAGKSAGAATQFSGCTIGGNAATEVVKSGATGTNATAIYSLIVASGTTADIVVSSAATLSNCRISVYTITGLASATAAGTAHTESASATASSVTCAMPLGGAAIGVATTDQVSGGITWAGLTSDDDAPNVDTDIEISAASYWPTAFEAARTVSASYTGSATNCAACVASWA